MTHQTNIIWDKGTAYDLFISLWILHRPDEFGLRPSWAAGVRSRLPVPMRDTLELANSVIGVPLCWIYQIPSPKDVSTVLETLAALPPEERLPMLVFGETPDEETQAYRRFLLSLDGKQRLTTKIEAQIQDFFERSKKKKAYIRAVFEAWSDCAGFGEAYLQALKAYVENFFQEEETRISPAHAQGLANARALAERKDVLALLEELSAGVRMDWLSDVSTIVLAPSFWSSPFVFFDAIDEDTQIVLFGARPKDVALVPGEMVPESLLNALKALSDPTRLRILKNLLEAPCTPSELAKLLRLRAPTVVHHLQNLRLAGLVLVTVSAKKERRYAAKMDGIEETLSSLRHFLSGE